MSVRHIVPSEHSEEVIAKRIVDQGEAIARGFEQMGDMLMMTASAYKKDYYENAEKQRRQAREDAERITRITRSQRMIYEEIAKQRSEYES